MSLHHPSLGKLRGRASDDGKTVQYRNIKYASIPGRWQDSTISDGPLPPNNIEEEYDATQHGPSCPQHASGFAYDLSLIGDVSLKLESTEMHELECCNLVVTAPQARKSDDGLLPVFVWVHGGGFSIGSNSWPQYDLERFVKTSSELGKPIIGVSINYRLGIFGFLSSEPHDISGNYALKDQVCAFQWIQKHISGFGGDPERITAAGESAGSICISHLLNLAPPPLFNQAILMSGDSTLRRARSREWHNKHFQSNMGLLGLSPSLRAEEQRDRLLELSAEEIVKKLPPFQHWSPVIDGIFIKSEVSLGMLSEKGGTAGRPNWCNRILMGDTAQDATCMKARIMDNPHIMPLLHASLAATCTAEQSARLLDAYGLTGTVSPERQYVGMQQLASDLRFYFPVLEVCEGWGDRAWRYHFHQQNPITGTYQSLASHELDVAYLLQNLPDQLSGDHAVLGQKMAEVWIAFVCDGKGWEREEGAERDVLVIGPDAKMSWSGEGEYDEAFRAGRGRILQEMGWERVVELGERLQGVWEI